MNPPGWSHLTTCQVSIPSLFIEISDWSFRTMKGCSRWNLTASKSAKITFLNTSAQGVVDNDDFLCIDWLGWTARVLMFWLERPGSNRVETARGCSCKTLTEEDTAGGDHSEQELLRVNRNWQHLSLICSLTPSESESYWEWLSSSKTEDRWPLTENSFFRPTK